MSALRKYREFIAYADAEREMLDRMLVARLTEFVGPHLAEKIVKETHRHLGESLSEVIKYRTDDFLSILKVYLGDKAYYVLTFLKELTRS